MFSYSRLLLDEIKIEQRILARETEERNYIERSILAEVDRLQLQIDQAKHDAEMAAQIGDTLHKEVWFHKPFWCISINVFNLTNEFLIVTQVAVLEATINEKKRQVEKLVAEMKEANLQSLAISPPEELKMILDGKRDNHCHVDNPGLLVVAMVARDLRRKFFHR